MYLDNLNGNQKIYLTNKFMQNNTPAFWLLSFNFILG